MVTDTGKRLLEKQVWVLEDFVGETIKAVAQETPGQITLLFEDGTWATITGGCDDSGDIANVADSMPYLNDLVALGLMTEAEMDEEHTAWEAENE